MQLKTAKKTKDELMQLDSRLAVLINKYGDIEISLSENYFESLASSIVGQQLSNKVADVIWNRLVKLLGGKTGGTPSAIKAPSNYKASNEYQITPEAIIAASAEDLRSVGLSINKAAYLKNLSQAVIDGNLNLDDLQNLGDEEIITQLTKVKGIGRWTAEMFLIFSLGRQDVFSMGDGGLYNAIKKLYGLDNPTKAQIQELTQRWSPYRSFASLYLWKSLDNAEDSAAEQITIVFENEKIRVEEIISNGAASPVDFWYDNPIDEWVSITAGNAILKFEDNEIALKSGENYYIKAHVRHRVESASADCRWLCVYLK